ncbi:ATP-binding cassette domain-containing protein [Streptomyces phaeofaciens]|uniref:ATP-binding cassette domain-containing protein n=1 Tax=Streptomyces phaeofaciens TaxID=68254 RepID=UPI003570A2DC
MGTLLGVLAARRPGSWLDRIVTSLAYTLEAAPVFWIALLVIWLFALQLGVFPAGGLTDTASEQVTPGQVADHLVLPAGVLPVSQLPWFTPYVRQGVGDALAEDPVRGARARGSSERTPVARDVSLTITPGEAVGLLGPSGCGKSTLARVAALLHRPDSGTLVLEGTPVRRWRHRAPREQRTAVGIVFQQPRLSADPRLRLHDLIAEPLRATGRREAVPDRVPELAEAVGLTPDLLSRRPHEVSDGQLQRACLARALVLRPRWLVCDEMTAMLDASTTAALVTVVEDYRRTTGAGLLAVGNDRVLLRRWCDRTADWDTLGEEAPAAEGLPQVMSLREPSVVPPASEG